MAEWQTRCLQVAVIYDRVGSTPTNRTIFKTNVMDDKLIDEVKQWNIDSALPPSVGDFKLTKEFSTCSVNGGDEEFLLFTYSDSHNGWSVRGTLDPATDEFSIRTDIRMLEFALIEFITEDFALYRQMVEERLPRLIRDYYVERQRNFSVILKEKGIPHEDWAGILPQEYKGLTCLVQPGEAVRIINGSYMILAYYSEELQSGLSVMYNVLRDDFFAERRIHNFPNLVHDFDSQSLRDLVAALQRRLRPVLDELIAELR